MNPTVEMGDVRFVSRTRELLFREPVEVISARHTAEVPACLEQVALGVSRGLHAAGHVAYDASPAFDPALSAHASRDLPPLWFGLYDKVETLPPKDAVGQPFQAAESDAFEVGPWSPLVGKADYVRAIGRIRDYIAAGDTYQVNYTFPLRASFRGDVLAWFRCLCRAQQADYCALVHTGRYVALSVSPELFFRLDGDMLETRPMKGTRPRGLWTDEDRRLAAELTSSEKDRAENVMIVDLLRNDMGRISEIGSVEVRTLFQTERYPTVWQMTSTIVSRTQADVPGIFRSLFPSGSVTGAPKVRTMQIIREVEPFPRGVYCGAIGWWSPGRRAEFNVAIRTVTVDVEGGIAHYGVGGGITWDSTPEGEYEECRVKAAMLTHRPPQFELLESILFDGEYFLLGEHMKRLADSAEYFGVTCDIAEVRSALARQAAVWTQQHDSAPRKVRLLVALDGTFRIESQPLQRQPGKAAPLRVGFAAEPVDPSDVFLYHKTTHREVYERAKASRPDCDDVLLWNRRGEITEGSSSNVVLDMAGVLLTPAVSSGLLAGTMRAYLLAGGQIREAVLTKEDVLKARSIWFINSVRKWMDVVFADRG